MRVSFSTLAREIAANICTFSESASQPEVENLVYATDPQDQTTIGGTEVQLGLVGMWLVLGKHPKNVVLVGYTERFVQSLTSTIKTYAEGAVFGDPKRVVTVQDWREVSPLQTSAIHAYTELMRSIHDAARDEERNRHAHQTFDAGTRRRGFVEPIEFYALPFEKTVISHEQLGVVPIKRRGFAFASLVRLSKKLFPNSNENFCALAELVARAYMEEVSLDPTS